MEKSGLFLSHPDTIRVIAEAMRDLQRHCGFGDDEPCLSLRLSSARRGAVVMALALVRAAEHGVGAEDLRVLLGEQMETLDLNEGHPTAKLAEQAFAHIDAERGRAAAEMTPGPVQAKRAG